MTGNPTNPGRPRSWILGALAGAVAVVVVALWVLGGFGSAHDAAHAPTAVESGAGELAGSDARTTDPAIAGERASLAPDDVVGAEPADITEGAAAPDSAVARWTGPFSTFTGQVVDHQGRALAGADVICWPDEATARALDIGWDCMGHELQAVPRTTTDSEGRFELRAPHVAAAIGHSLINEYGRALIDEYGRYPWLLVEASGFAVRSVQCLGLDAGDLDVGTIAVEPGGSLSGRVVDEQGRPIEGARLQARQDRFEPRFVASKEKDWMAYEHIEPAVSDISGEDGRFELGGFWPGTASLQWVTAEGYLPRAGRAHIEVRVGATLQLDDVVLSQGESLSGIVVDEAGAPIEGASVYVQEPPSFSQMQRANDPVMGVLEEMRRSGLKPVQTSADGRFTASALAAVNLELCAEAPGFEPTRMQDLTTGLQDVRIPLVRQAILSLTVVGGNPPAPVTDARVEAFRMSGALLGKQPNLAVRPGPDPGAFVVERIGTFRTDLVVSAAGFATGSFSAPGAKPPETIELTVTLEPEARVGGRVLNLEGQPIAGAQVSASGPRTSKTRPPSAKTLAGADGRYEFTGLVAGEWKLRAKADGYIDGDWPVSVTAGQGLDGIDLQLERGAEVFGTYFGADGQPLRGEQILLSLMVSGRPTIKLTVHSNVTGEYLAPNLKPGQWEVGYREKVPVELLPGQRVRLDLHAPRKPRISGQVLAGGRPKSGSFVIAFDKTSEERFGDLLPRGTTKTDTDGRYEIELDAGEWILQAGGYDPPCGATSRVPLTLAWGDERVVDLVFSGERLSVLVVDADHGQALEGATWYLEPRSEADPPTLTFSFGNPGDMIGFWPPTDSQGRAELPYVPPGAYTLNCSRNGYLPRSVPDVVIVAGEPRELRIELESEALLTGRVKLSSGAPVKDRTQVSLEAVDAEQGDPRKTFTENGFFSFTGVPDGEYRLAVWAPHAATAGEPGAQLPIFEQRITLKAGDPRTVDLLLPP